jgi:hypothetical protein
VIIKQKENLKGTHGNFYKNLYKAQNEVPSQPHSRHRVLDSMPKIITPLMNLKLTQTIPIEDLHVATKSIAREKAPKLDGIVFEFYIFF